MMKRTWLFPTLGLAALALTAQVASADVNVYVGYADGLRPTSGSYFPNPWDGSSNTTFLGGGGSYDAGAIMLVNTGASAVTLDPGAFVDGFYGNTYTPGTIWDSLIGSGISILPGHNLILTQTYAYNFDTSDYNYGSSTSPDHDIPVIHLTLDGVTQTFSDTEQVLNTGGFDLASISQNEALNWRLIGTTGIGNPNGNPPGVPEPGVVSLVGSGLLGLGGLALRRRARRK